MGVAFALVSISKYFNQPQSATCNGFYRTPGPGGGRLPSGLIILLSIWRIQGITIYWGIHTDRERASESVYPRYWHSLNPLETRPPHVLKFQLCPPHSHPPYPHHPHISMPGMAISFCSAVYSVAEWHGSGGTISLLNFKGQGIFLNHWEEDQLL